MFQIRDTKHKRDNVHRGYTLVEVMIAMAIFAVGILAIFSMQITATSSNALARGLTENYNAAIDKVEELLALPYDDDFLRTGVHPDDFGDFTQATDGIDNNGDGNVDEGGETGPLTISWQVWENIVHDQNIKSVRVTISSTVNRNDRRNINIDFLKANM